jgi:hypothetical protein
MHVRARQEDCAYGYIFSCYEYNELIQWRKNMKVDPKAYKEFKNEMGWNLYKKHFKATVKSHAIEHLIDKNHVPTNLELDKLQRALLFKVMQDNFKQLSCKAIVIARKDTKDLRAIWHGIKKMMEKSILSQIKSARLFTFLTSARLATMDPKGTQTNYIYYYKKQACTFNENSKDAYTKKMLC